ncbi:MAG: tRNA (N6-isopentenyl adenosine(37)-C2)-methylthiotransferase MiaB [Chloroflexi bacterium]|nr:tRNA (N6-isopentenyl adenosine(37)-C2)-methylthiotransferase MiaB [Chloroflexota bacterium]
MPTYHVWTVGCQMNVADSQRLDLSLERMGLERVGQIDEADVVVVNTCVVRQSAEDTATGLLGRLGKDRANHPGRVIAVMGCMVGPDQADLKRRFPQVDVWARPQEFQPIVDIVGARTGLSTEGCLANLTPHLPDVSTFVPIVHGCDKFCTFCIIPYRRGREMSRPVAELVDEVTRLIGRGVKEVTLLGQNVDSYGHDLRPRVDLADLMEELHEISGLKRIRFLTSHPNDMSRRIIRAIAELPKVCENVNLPFQAGDDRILAEMRRGYTRAQFMERVHEIRETVPGVTLTTDLIVGFPGETDAEFEQSLLMLEEVRFDKVHSAAYSEREGTYASRRMPETVPREEKKRRLGAANDLQALIQTELNADLVGLEFDILVDGETRGRLRGRTRGDKLVYVTGGGPALGETVMIGITGASPWSLVGDLRATQSQKELVST